MTNYLQIILMVLFISLISAIIATNVINGVKNALAIDKAWLNRIITIVVDIVISLWVYFVVVGKTDYFTYAVVLLLTYSGAETIYSIIGQLQDVKNMYHEQQLIDESKIL